MIHVACASDTGYLPHVATLMYSLRRQHNAKELQFHFLHLQDIDRHAKDQLIAYAQQIELPLECHEIPSESVKHLPDMGRISQVMWLRLNLAECLPDIPRVLYLDCDTLLLERLDPLWKTSLGEAWLAAVRNVFEAGWERHAARFGSSDGSYFNSGVLLIDLDAWRKHRCKERILALATAQSSGIVWPDQDAMNKVCADNWTALAPRWNSQNSMRFFPHAAGVFTPQELQTAINQPSIVHFEGGLLAKPWHYLCKHPYRHHYRRWRTKTPWPLQTLEGFSLLNVVLRPLPFRQLVACLNFISRVKKKLARTMAHYASRPPS